MSFSVPFQNQFQQIIVPGGTSWFEPWTLCESGARAIRTLSHFDPKWTANKQTAGRAEWRGGLIYNVFSTGSELCWASWAGGSVRVSCRSPPCHLSALQPFPSAVIDGPYVCCPRICGHNAIYLFRFCFSYIQKVTFCLFFVRACG